MKFSEAIFLGAKLSPQGFGELLGRDGSRCAFGAALQAVGANSSDSLRVLWPWRQERREPCPECGDVDAVNFIISTHLNDSHRWTRERIAYWVASVEPVEAAEKSEPISDSREAIKAENEQPKATV